MIRPGDMAFASNHVQLRLRMDALKGWVLTQAVVSRLVAATAHDDGVVATSAGS